MGNLNLRAKTGHLNITRTTSSSGVEASGSISFKVKICLGNFRSFEVGRR
jgi:hypothetical protein